MGLLVVLRIGIMKSIDKKREEHLDVVVPGDRLGSLDKYSPGAGTYVRFGHLYANRAGYKVVERLNEKVCF